MQILLLKLLYDTRRDIMSALSMIFSCEGFMLTLNVVCISQSYIEIKINLNFNFTLICGASKAFMKPFEAPQRRVKIKI